MQNINKNSFCKKNLINRNDFLDMEKCFACILVIFIHCQIQGDFSGIIIGFARSAVGLFFVISGYYLFGVNDRNIKNIVEKKVVKIIRLTAYSLLFYFLWESALRFFGSGIQSLILWYKDSLFTFHTLYTTIIWDVDPLAGHLWFLFALIKCYFIFYILYKYLYKFLEIAFFFDGTILVFFRFFISQMYYRNGLIYGMFFFLSGYFIAKNKSVIIEKFNKNNLSLILILSTLVLICEYFWLGIQQIYIGNLFITFSAFILSLLINFKLNNIKKLLIYIGRNLSMYIYIIHWAIIDVFNKIGKELNLNSEIWYLYFRFILVVLISIIFSLIFFELICLNKKRRLLRL